MGRNARDTPGYSTPNAGRDRKNTMLTLSEGELSALGELATARGLSRSRAAGQAILEAAAATSRKTSGKRPPKKSTVG